MTKVQKDKAIKLTFIKKQIMTEAKIYEIALYKYPIDEFWIGAGDSSRLYDQNARDRAVFIKGFKEALNIAGVNNQRELLIDFAKYMDIENDIFVASWEIDRYLKVGNQTMTKHLTLLNGTDKLVKKDEKIKSPTAQLEDNLIDKYKNLFKNNF